MYFSLQAHRTDKVKNCVWTIMSSTNILNIEEDLSITENDLTIVSLPQRVPEFPAEDPGAYVTYISSTCTCHSNTLIWTSSLVFSYFFTNCKIFHPSILPAFVYLHFIMAYILVYCSLIISFLFAASFNIPPGGEGKIGSLTSKQGNTVVALHSHSNSSAVQLCCVKSDSVLPSL